MNKEEYKNLVEATYGLILNEYSNPTDLELQYPKFIIMYEFFRLLRGEAFYDQRDPVGEYQKEIYAMEDNLVKILLELKKQLPEDSDKVKVHMEEMISSGLRV